MQKRVINEKIKVSSCGKRLYRSYSVFGFWCTECRLLCTAQVKWKKRFIADKSVLGLRQRDQKQEEMMINRHSIACIKWPPLFNAVFHVCFAFLSAHLVKKTKKKCTVLVIHGFYLNLLCYVLVTFFRHTLPRERHTGLKLFLAFFLFFFLLESPTTCCDVWGSKWHFIEIK